ncbi:MAG: hypothetical protein ACXACC_01705 [Promethearchaeota archaeon]|jgi:hypothetical protein
MKEETLIKDKKKDQFCDSLEKMWGNRSNGTKKLTIKLSSGNNKNGKINESYNIISSLLKDFFSQ